MRKEEFDTYEQKNQAERMVMFLASMKYTLNEGTIFDVIKELESSYIAEEKVKGIDKIICYHSDKIQIASKMLCMKRLCNKNQEDALAICDYIQNEIDKIRKAVKE